MAWACKRCYTCTWSINVTTLNQFLKRKIFTLMYTIITFPVKVFCFRNKYIISSLTSSLVFRSIISVGKIHTWDNNFNVSKSFAQCQENNWVIIWLYATRLSLCIRSALWLRKLCFPGGRNIVYRYNIEKYMEHEFFLFGFKHNFQTSAKNTYSSFVLCSALGIE